MSEQQIGGITHWFGKIKVIVIEIHKGKLSVGDTIRIKGQTTDFTHTIDSMQLDGETVEKAKKGQSVGVKVSTRARRTDSVFKIAD
jgi:putative protease